MFQHPYSLPPKDSPKDSPITMDRSLHAHPMINLIHLLAIAAPQNDGEPSLYAHYIDHTNITHGWAGGHVLLVPYTDFIEDFAEQCDGMYVDMVQHELKRIPDLPKDWEEKLYIIF